MIPALLKVFFLTYLPVFEMRYSIPVGILDYQVKLPFGYTWQGLALPWWQVFIVAVLANIILAVILYFALNKFVILLRHNKKIEAWWHRRMEKMQAKVQKYVDRWGIIGLALFISLPIPGSGVWTGTIGSYALGFKFKRFMIASVIGVLLAATIITALTVFGKTIF